jgi:hypothetical protein
MHTHPFRRHFRRLICTSSRFDVHKKPSKAVFLTLAYTSSPFDVQATCQKWHFWRLACTSSADDVQVVIIPLLALQIRAGHATIRIKRASAAAAFSNSPEAPQVLAKTRPPVTTS